MRRASLNGGCRLIQCAYSTQSALLIGDRAIASSSRVQQRDQLGPLLCTLVVNDIALSVGTHRNIWYLNNLIIDSSSESVIDSHNKS